MHNKFHELFVKDGGYCLQIKKKSNLNTIWLKFRGLNEKRL